jgi:hypothetical protein
MVLARSEDPVCRAFDGNAPDPWLTFSAWLWLAYFAAVATLLGWLL